MVSSAYKLIYNGYGSKTNACNQQWYKRIMLKPKQKELSISTKKTWNQFLPELQCNLLSFQDSRLKDVIIFIGSFYDIFQQFR